MKTLAMIAATSAGLAASGALAAPSLLIRNAAANVTVIPENRPDIQVSVSHADGRLPLKVSRDGEETRVEGNLMFRSMNCHRGLGGERVRIYGSGDFARSELPAIIVRTPMNAQVSAGGAVFGSVGRSGSLSLSSSGCGDWTAANVAGPMSLHAAGSGDIRAGEAASGDIGISGSANVSTRMIRNGLRAHISGSGDLDVARVDGPLEVHVSGSGNVVAHDGSVSAMAVQVAGSGDVRFDGVTQSLSAAVAGSGDVTVRKVVGPVSRHVAGSGTLRIGG